MNDNPEQGNVVQLRPYQNWSPEELHAGLQHQVERAKHHMDIAEIYIAELALRGMPVSIPEGA